jgi:hypothetical protein
MPAVAIAMVDRVLFDWRKFEEEKDPEAIWREEMIRCVLPLLETSLCWTGHSHNI